MPPLPIEGPGRYEPLAVLHATVDHERLMKLMREKDGVVLPQRPKDPWLVYLVTDAPIVEYRQLWSSVIIQREDMCKVAKEESTVVLWALSGHQLVMVVKLACPVFAVSWYEAIEHGWMQPAGNLYETCGYAELSLVKYDSGEEEQTLRGAVADSCAFSAVQGESNRRDVSNMRKAESDRGGARFEESESGGSRFEESEKGAAAGKESRRKRGREPGWGYGKEAGKDIRDEAGMGREKELEKGQGKEAEKGQGKEPEKGQGKEAEKGQGKEPFPGQGEIVMFLPRLTTVMPPCPVGPRATDDTVVLCATVDHERYMHLVREKDRVQLPQSPEDPVEVTLVTRGTALECKELWSRVIIQSRDLEKVKIEESVCVLWTPEGHQLVMVVAIADQDFAHVWREHMRQGWMRRASNMKEACGNMSLSMVKYSSLEQDQGGSGEDSESSGFESDSSVEGRKERWDGERNLWRLQNAMVRGVRAGEVMAVLEARAFFDVREERKRRGLPKMTWEELRRGVREGIELVPEANETGCMSKRGRGRGRGRGGGRRGGRGRGREPVNVQEGGGRTNPLQMSGKAPALVVKHTLRGY